MGADEREGVGTAAGTAQPPSLDEAENVEVDVEAALTGAAPEPSTEFRRAAWEAFQAALARHLARTSRR